MQELFGGSETKSQATSTPVDATPGAFKALQGPLSDVLKGLLSGGQANPIGGIPQYTGPTTAPVGQEEQAFLTALQGLRGGVGGATLKDTVEGKYVSPDTNPFLDAFIKAAQRPTLQGLEETLTRSLPGRFTAAGQFVNPQGSSAFDRAAAIATRGAADAIGDIATRISAGAYESERGRQQQGIALGQSEVDTTIKNLQAQALPRLIQQYGLDVGLQQFRDRLNALLSVLGIGANVAQPRITQQSQQTSEGNSDTGIIPAFGQFFGGLGSMGKAGML